MMRIFILFFLMFLSVNGAFALSEKKTEDKVYTVPIAKSEILIEKSAPPLKKISNERPASLYYAGIVRGSLNYKLSTLRGDTTHFSPTFVGVNAGIKTANHFYLFNGYFQLDGEWQNFKRESGVFSQKLNVFQIDLIQNVDLYWSSKRLFYFSAGLGVSPVYLTAEQSVFGNSFTSFGAMGILKFDFVFPLKSKDEIDLGLKGGWGSVGGREIFLSTLGLGVNFD